MKKYVILLTLACGSLSAYGQKSKIRDARDYLSDNNYKKAIPVINEAVANEDTKNSADAWYLRGMAYLQKAIDTTAHAPEAAGESYTSLMKALSIKPDFGTEINNALYSNALLSFNEGVAAYSKQDYSTSYDKFMRVVTIYNAGGKSRFASDKGFTDLVASAKSNAAYSAYNAKRDAEALTLFNELKSTKDSNVYQAMIDINQRQSNDAATLASISEARAQFPNNHTFRDLELNYYIRQNKSDVLISKLETAIQSDPNNADLLFNLGNIYERAAFPKGAVTKPANFNELFSKAESNYQRAVAVKSDNPDYNYNLGVLYYELAGDYTKQLVNIKGTSPAENKQYEELLAQQKTNFAKALPYFESSYKAYDAKGTNMTSEDKTTYQNVMTGLREIYSRSNNKAKADEMTSKISASKK